MTIEIKFDENLKATAIRLEAEAEAALEALEADITERSGLVKGTLYSDSSGRVYELDGASVSIQKWGYSKGTLNLSLRAFRHYKTGRRNAYSPSYFGASQLTPYVPETTPDAEKLRKQRERAAARLAALDAQLDKGTSGA